MTISCKSVLNNIDCINSLLMGYRGVGFLSLDLNDEEDKYVYSKLKKPILYMEFNCKWEISGCVCEYNNFIIYLESHTKQAEELYIIAKKYDGHLTTSIKYENDIRKIGQLLEYHDHEIEDFIKGLKTE